MTEQRRWNELLGIVSLASAAGAVVWWRRRRPALTFARVGTLTYRRAANDEA
jgi:hypothetical protein